jgi:arabinan endo-1,5-alpha-L-arabinosidase
MKISNNRASMGQSDEIHKHHSVTGRRHILRSLGFLAGACLTELTVPRLVTQAGSSRAPKPVLRVGTFTRIYDPSIGEKQPWYINDHTFIRAENSRWHLFGITHQEPANAQQEKFFAHATAPDLLGPWTKQPPVLPVDEAIGETVVWAPYVLRDDGLYWMFYCAGGKEHEKYRIHLATSDDLFHWKRHPANPMVVDGYDARDPMVVKNGGQWILYYAATTEPKGGNHTVKAATSRDLVHWSPAVEVFRDAETGTYGGPTESPFVVPRNGKYFLFVCSNHGYNETTVYESETPFHWAAERKVARFPAHAAEVIQAAESKWYVSRAGWGQGGVYLAELTWEN